jgi:hypothetical protein
MTGANTKGAKMEWFIGLVLLCVIISLINAYYNV